jgi:hypothetical protein
MCNGVVPFVGARGAWGTQASVNPKAETVEELQGRRKGLHMGMVKLAKEDLNLTLQAAFDAYTVLLLHTPCTHCYPP